MTVNSTNTCRTLHVWGAFSSSLFRDTVLDGWDRIGTSRRGGIVDTESETEIDRNTATQLRLINTGGGGRRVTVPLRIVAVACFVSQRGRFWGQHPSRTSSVRSVLWGASLQSRGPATAHSVDCECTRTTLWKRRVWNELLRSTHSHLGYAPGLIEWRLMKAPLQPCEEGTFCGTS